MNRRHFIAGAAAGMTFLQAQPDEDGFASMFDAKTLQGWMDSGLYIHAPEHGPGMYCGVMVHIFQERDAAPNPQSMGAIFPLIPPLKVNVHNKGEWNSMRVLSDWPKLQVWTNDELIQDLNLDKEPELRLRLRKGYIGIESLSYPIRFRNLRIRELPSKDKWQDLYVAPADLSKWHVSDGKPRFEAAGEVLHLDGLGYLATNERFRDFELQTYIRHARHHKAASCSGATGVDRARGTMRSNCTTWRGRTIRPAHCTGIGARSIRALRRRDGIFCKCGRTAGAAWYGSMAKT